MDSGNKQPGNDPWVPQTSSLVGNPPPQQEMLSSEEYVACLEAKLDRVKGRAGREVKPKDILQGLSDAKETQMRSLVHTSEPSCYQSDDSEPLEGSRAAALHRRLYPERQALTLEELMSLIENDDLSKHHQHDQDNAEAEANTHSATADKLTLCSDGKGDAVETNNTATQS